MIASVAFGFLVAPFAFYIATSALNRFGATSSTDPAIRRQLILMHRLSAGLLIAWAFLIGGWLKALLS